MNRLVSAWEELLREVTVGDYDEMQNAMFLVSMVLERHNYPKRISQELHEEYLPRDLLRLTLDDRRQTETVDFLAGMIQAQRQDADTFLYALARVKPSLMVTPLLKLLRDEGERWNPEARYEALNALNAAFKDDNSGIAAALNLYDPSDVLDMWADDADEALADRADQLLEKVEQLLGVDS